MYSSLDRPTLEEWKAESDALLRGLAQELEDYEEKVRRCQEEENAALLRYYCLKMRDALKRLEIEKVVSSMPAEMT